MGLEKLEQTVRFEDQPCFHGTCYCLVCHGMETLPSGHAHDQPSHPSKKTDEWLLKILNGLQSNHTPSLALFVPDICFVQGSTLQAFHTDPKDSRIRKLAGLHPVRTLYQVMVRLRRRYKWMLGENYKKKFIQTLDPGFMHEKYLDNLVPTCLNMAEMIDHKKNSKNGEQTYVLHKNEKLLDENIEEHKLQDHESFCTVHFKHGANQIFTKAEFEKWVDMRNKGLLKSAEISYVQAFIKEKQEAEAFFVSVFELGPDGQGAGPDFDAKLYESAESEVLVLLGGISQYSSRYADLEIFQEETERLMGQDPRQYVKLMTYKIVHYLAMAARTYVKHIKINWILNDIGQIYLQNLLELETIQIAVRPLKYRLPPKEKDSLFYKDSEHFLMIYNQLRANNDHKRKKIRQELIRERSSEPAPHRGEPLSNFAHSKQYSTIEPLRGPSRAQGNLKSQKVRANSFFSQRRHHSEYGKFAV